ncbi:MAG: family 78 glycoside hydrolase catalytic domain [Lachnospiraceae bacterium]|nr:family 78 glycoside hydrolase catalytic domain [Lachnospiraceae bacterium]
MNVFTHSAKKITEKYSFGPAARWIRAEKTARYSHHLFRGTFELAKAPEKAVLLVLAANYAEVYLNGESAASAAERSYVFDKAYEVYDVTEYLHAGKNVAAVINVDTGEEVRAGFALEILADGESVLTSGSNWVYADDKAVAPGANFDIGLVGSQEYVRAADWIEEFAEIDYDDSEWKPAFVIGNELLHKPFDAFHQSMTHEPTTDIQNPVSYAAVMLAKSPEGYPVKLVSLGSGVTCAMTRLALARTAEIRFAVPGGIQAIAIDGCRVENKKAVSLKAGEHFLVIAYGGNPEFVIETREALRFAVPNGAERTGQAEQSGSAPDGVWNEAGDVPAFVGYLAKVPAVLYPWNGYRGRAASADMVDAILAAPSYDALPDAVRGALKPIAVEQPKMVRSEIMTRSYLVPENGFAEDRIFHDSCITRTNERIKFINKEGLLADTAAVIPPQEGIVNFILDFGEEQVGRVLFSLNAPAGTVVDIHGFEMITDNGIKYMGDPQTMRYLCREGEQTWLSRRRRGFRYLSVSVWGQTRDVTIHSIQVMETRYPVTSAGFSCSDEALCRIYKMSARTAEVCMLDLYVDCPGYEQNPWTGDARVTALVNMLNFGAFEFDAQYLRLIAQSIEDGLYYNHRIGNPRYEESLYLPCACFPTYPEGCIPVWSFMWLLQIWDHYTCTGDGSVVKDVFYAVKETMSRCEKMTNSRGLFDMQGAWNLIEWSNNDLEFYGEVTANNVMLSYAFGKAADMAQLLGETELAVHYRSRQSAYRDAVNRYCWSEEKRAYVDTARDEYSYRRYCEYMEKRGMEKESYETYLSKARISVQSNTMAILYDCVPDERLDDAKRFLIDNLESGCYVAGTPVNRTPGDPSEEEAPGGYVHIGSPFFLFFALKAAYKLGYDELALNVQRRDWSALLESNLTTCIETFKNGRDWARSVAHAWSASPAVFLISEVLGVRAVKPGYQEFVIEPKTSGLTFAKGSVPTPYGPIAVEWKKDGNGALSITCAAPAQCKRIRI